MNDVSICQQKGKVVDKAVKDNGKAEAPKGIAQASDISKAKVAEDKEIRAKVVKPEKVSQAVVEPKTTDEATPTPEAVVHEDSGKVF